MRNVMQYVDKKTVNDFYFIEIFINYLYNIL